ncbi:unnamed protein product [Rotaria sordida]|uniref:Rho-GAP domain-containing protein n=1 Tax=Rotaria sordida TaxID=392033 RepID=A0A818MIW2_9BILA|nr:unnamed protein product [Rotaria sordida]CAF3589958.1 unnamed protein product [Rotaria sordida]
MSTLSDDRDPTEGEDERDRKRKLFSTKTNASREKSSTLLIGNEPNEESLTTAQDFKSLLRPKKKNGFKLIKTKTKVSSEQKERRSSLKDEKRKSKTNRDSVASTAGLVEQLRLIIGLSLEEATKHNPLQNDDLAVPRFLVDCINIIDQAHPQDSVYRQEPVKIKQPADLENALKQPLTPAFAVSLLKRFLKELPEQLIPPELSSAIFKIINDPNPDSNRFIEIRNLIQKFPKSNRDTMRLLFLHFHDIIHQSQTMSPTQTSSSSKSSESSFIPVTIATLIKSKERAVKYLIQHATDIFERPQASSTPRVSLIKNVSRSSLHSETIEELEAELVKQEALLNKMHEEMQKSQPTSSTYGTTTPTNIDKDKEEQLWTQQRLVTALKRKIKQETRRLQQNRLSSFLEHSASTTASASHPESTLSHQPEVILIVNKREEPSKTQQIPGSNDEIPKVSTVPLSPKPVRQREQSGVETDDDELLGQIQKIFDNNAGIAEEELLKEKITEARLLARLKTIYKLFMNEKENLTKLEQQMSDKSSDLSVITPTTTTITSENDISSNQTVDILQELLNTIKQNNQLETKIEAIKRNIDNENERIEELCIELRFGILSSKIHLQNNNNNNNNTNPSQSPSTQSAPTLVQVTKL